MGSLALHLLTILLGVIFIVLGNIKITPQFFPEYHNQAKNEFGKWNKEFPFYHLTGWRPYAKNYRMAIGVIEMSAGTLLLLAGSISQSIATVALLVIMGNVIYTFHQLNYSVEYMAGAIVLTSLLLLRMILATKSKATRVVKRVKQEKEEKTK